MNSEYLAKVGAEASDRITLEDYISLGPVSTVWANSVYKMGFDLSFEKSTLLPHSKWKLEELNLRDYAP